MCTCHIFSSPFQAFQEAVTRDIETLGRYLYLPGFDISPQLIFLASKHFQTLVLSAIDYSSV